MEEVAEMKIPTEVIHHVNQNMVDPAVRKIVLRKMVMEILHEEISMINIQINNQVQNVDGVVTLKDMVIPAVGLQKMRVHVMVANLQVDVLLMITNIIRCMAKVAGMKNISGLVAMTKIRMTIPRMQIAVIAAMSVPVPVNPLQVVAKENTFSINF